MEASRFRSLAPSTARRARKTGGDRRRELPESWPKTSKREWDHAEPWSPPAHIRGFGVELSDELRKHIRRKLGMKLGKFGDFIERVSVRVEDLNGPRGGVDHECRIKVVLSALPSVIVVERNASLAAAIDGAIAAAQKATRSAVQRRRTLPVRRAEAPRRPRAAPRRG